MTTTALKGHNSADTAYVVADYPYGFKLRTQIRYWLDTNKNGTRFVSQTLNPKTGAWNKPKASTYCSLGVMVRNEATGYIGWVGWTPYAGEVVLREFVKTYDEALTAFDKAHIAGLFILCAKAAARKVSP